jgi:cell division protein ZapD
VIIYEHPFNERIRTYLRLEQLFSRLQELVARSHPLDHHFALTTLFEIMEVGARSDLKSDVLRDLDRQKQTLNAFRGNPSIAQDVLEAVLHNMDKDLNYLTTQPGKAGHVLTENDWLMSIRSRVGIPGGTCAFDLPAYYAWQHESEAKRQTDLRGWVAHLTPLGDSVKILLQLLRDSGVPQKVMANAGQFQQNLPQGRTFQLLRLSLDPTLGLVPEISANRLMVSIRLMRQAADDRLQPIGEDETFELTLCS